MSRFPSPWRSPVMAAVICALTIVPAASGAATTTAAAATAAVTTAAVTSSAPTAVPKTFKAASISWLSAKQGWVLGSAACGKKSCATVVGTTDGGTKWSRVGSMPVPLANGSTPSDVGVNGVRFASATVGWAFGPALFHTGNGGRSWTRSLVPGGGKQVLALAVTKTSAYAVVSPCKEFAATCKAKTLSLWRDGSLTGQHWARISLHLGINSFANIAAFGSTVYVVDPGVPGTLDASTDGLHFSARPSPCDAAQGVGLAQAVPTSAADVALLCNGNPGISKATKTVYRSVNTGKTDTSAGTTGPLGISADLAAAPSGSLLVGAWANGSWMYLNDSHKTKWSTVLALGDGGAGFRDLTFVTSKIAWVVYGPVSDFSADFGKLYTSGDGGTTWRLVTP